MTPNEIALLIADARTALESIENHVASGAAPERLQAAVDWLGLVSSKLKASYDLAAPVVAPETAAAIVLGSITTEKKAVAARLNGAKGGRPRKYPPNEVRRARNSKTGGTKRVAFSNALTASARAREGKSGLSLA